MGTPEAASWRMMGRHGFADLSPPEAEHSMLELPSNRAEYVSVLQELADYPARSPLGQRVPEDDEVAALARAAGGWRAIVMLEDERALRSAAGLFKRVFVIDPLYDCGALLYAAWHDPLIRDEHSRRLAEQAGLLVRTGSLLTAGTAILAPDHLPGSWNPRPGWRQPRPTADEHQLAAWSMRTSLVLLYWADRLDGTVCTAQSAVISALETVLGPGAACAPVELAEPACIDDAQTARGEHLSQLASEWASIRRLSRRRTRRRLKDVASALTTASKTLLQGTEERSWRVVLGEATLPEPSLLLRRVLNGQDPQRKPRLPLKALKRRPLCLIAATD